MIQQNLLLGIYLEETHLKKYMHPNVHCSTYNSQDVEATYPFALVQAQGATGLMCVRSNPDSRELSVSFSLIFTFKFAFPTCFF